MQPADSWQPAHCRFHNSRLASGLEHPELSTPSPAEPRSWHSRGPLGIRISGERGLLSWSQKYRMVTVLSVTADAHKVPLRLRARLTAGLHFSHRWLILGG